MTDFKLDVHMVPTDDDHVGLSVCCEAQDIGLTDKMQVLNVIAKALHLNNFDIMLFGSLYGSGCLDGVKREGYSIEVPGGIDNEG